MLRVTLKDGRVVGGYFGDGSLAGYSQIGWREEAIRLTATMTYMTDERRLPPVEKRGGYQPQNAAPSPLQPPPPPRDSASSAKPPTPPATPPPSSDG
jgi:hypothetical protein